MLKTLPVPNEYQNIQCGNVFYLDQKTYHVACLVCHEKILYQCFPKHFRTKHLENGYNINLLDISENKIESNFVDSAEVKQEDEDPIASEIQGNVNTAKLLDKIRRIDEEDGTLSKANIIVKEWESSTIFIEEKNECTLKNIQTSDDEFLNEENGEENSDADTDGTNYEKRIKGYPEFLPFQCPICKRRFESERKMSNHKRGHGRPKHSKKKDKPKTQELKCDQCDKIFRNEREQECHKYTHTGIFCDVCGLKFSQLGNLRRHKLRHTGVKSFKCDDCDKSFYTVKELDCHKVWHTGQFRYICEICAKPCVHKANLKQHMRRHTGERPFKCGHCGKCFFTQHDLNVHSVGHSDERPFACDICGSTFRLKKALRVHKKIHIKERPFVCEICNKGFILDAGLKAHMRCHDGTLTKIAQITGPQKFRMVETTIPIEPSIELDATGNWENNVEIENVI